MKHLKTFNTLDELKTALSAGTVGYPWVCDIEDKDEKVQFMPIPTAVTFDLQLQYEANVPSTSTASTITMDKITTFAYGSGTLTYNGIYHDTEAVQITYPENTDFDNTKTITSSLTWNASAKINGNQDITSALTATYTITQDKMYTDHDIKFYDENNVEITSYTIAHGATVVPPTMPEREGYDFAWTPAFSATSLTDVNYKATYTIKTYIIKFVNEDDSVISNIQYNHGETITIPANPTKEGYTFSGWLPVVNPTAVADATYKATYAKMSGLKFTAIDGTSTIYINQKYGRREREFYISTNGQDYIPYEYTNIKINSGESIYIKGNNPNGLGTSDYDTYTFYITGKTSCEGNVMSLLGEDITEIPSECCFHSLFYGCTGLTSAPELPATVLKEGCYNAMFADCSSLLTAPELPATTIPVSAYTFMFDLCSSLVTAPELPATTLASDCYNGMFAQCSSLVNAPSILPAMTLADRCYYQMFYMCEKLEKAPELPALSLAFNCYVDMFKLCYSLNYLKANFIDLGEGWGATANVSGWLTNVSTTGTFVKNPESTWTAYESYIIPNTWTITTE